MKHEGTLDRQPRRPCLNILIITPMRVYNMSEGWFAVPSDYNFFVEWKNGMGKALRDKCPRLTCRMEAAARSAGSSELDRTVRPWSHP